MTDRPVDLDKHRGMAAQKATDLRRALADVENNLRELREREAGRDAAGAQVFRLLLQLFEIRALDAFPMTHHFETFALFRAG